MAGWIKLADPTIRNKGPFINTTANDLTVAGSEVIATPAPVSRSNGERKFSFWRQDTGEFIDLPYDVPATGPHGEPLPGFRMDCQKVQAVVHAGRLKLWCLHYKGEDPVRDLVVYDTGWSVMP